MKRIIYAVFLFMILIAAGANASDSIASGSNQLDYEPQSASESLELEVSQTASDSSEIPEGENASQTATMTAPLPERIDFPVNPWTGKNAVFLDKFLAQNWFIENKQRDFRKLALGIIAAETENREFRAETELLLRDPGYKQIYSALIILPVLLGEQTELLQEAGIKTAQQINKKTVSSKNGIDNLFNLVKKQLDEINHFEALTAKIRRICKQYTTIINRKTRLSNLHNLVRTYNRLVLKIITGHLEKFTILINKYRLKLEDLKVKLNYLRDGNNNNRVAVAARLTELFRQCDQVLINLEDYKESSLDFTVKFKNELSEGEKKLRNYASSVEQNLFHIYEYAGNFPDRDCNLQKTEVFRYKKNLEAIFAYNCHLFEDLKMLELVEREMVEAETYHNYLLTFNDDLTDFANYNELFDSLYNPELILEPVLNEIEDEEEENGQK